MSMDRFDYKHEAKMRAIETAHLDGDHKEEPDEECPLCEKEEAK